MLKTNEVFIPILMWFPLNKIHNTLPTPALSTCIQCTYLNLFNLFANKVSAAQKKIDDKLGLSGGPILSIVKCYARKSI